jgi:vanillate O-demethylase monooxygenase subunit
VLCRGSIEPAPRDARGAMRAETQETDGALARPRAAAAGGTAMTGGFVTDAWYVAAWSDELTDRPLTRTLLDRAVTLVRQPDGRPRARAGGDCPAIERHRCVWVWTGDPAKADPATIRDFHWLEQPGWAAIRRQAHVACHYQLIIDNLLVLSHLADPAPAGRAQLHTERLPDGVRVSRWSCDSALPADLRGFGADDAAVDHWQIAEFRAPASFVVDRGAAAAGSGAADGLAGVARRGFVACHGITPESAGTTHYFWALAHPLDAGGPAAPAAFQQRCQAALAADIAVFETQQRMIDLDPGAATTDISYDGGPQQARRLIERLLARQQAAAPASVAADPTSLV